MEPIGINENNPSQLNSEKPLTGGSQYPRVRSQLGLTLCFFGFALFIFGLKPDVFGLSTGLSVGFAQLLTFLVGLGFLTWGGTIVLAAFWPKGQQSLLANFGQRVAATGYMIAVFTGLADAFGFGTNPLPDVYLGFLQQRGVFIGMGIILIGLLMMVRYKRPQSPPL
ncbi:MAG: hypothetical protein VB108_08700 [Anaerolineaceae bacterium]|nr:hypothetical protein [Anaerolineaceae bacterium]